LDVVKVLEVAGGVLLLSGRLVPFGLVLLTPVAVNIALFDVLLVGQPALGVVLTALCLFLVWAYFGYWINLFNLIPFGMLDGGWILAPVSKWIQVAGLAILAGLFFAGLINPLVLIVVAIGMPMVYRRFREPDYDAYLTSGPASARLAIGATWLALVVFLGVAFYQTEGMLQTFLR